MQVGPAEQLWIMGASGLVGALVSASMEANEIHRRNTEESYVDLPHSLLMAIRVGVATMIAYVLLGGWGWRILTLIAFAACCFGPVHRIYLNYLRITKYPQESKGLTIFHLRKKGIDNLFFFIPSEPIRFIAMCSLELLIAGAIYVQTSAQ